jgi:hypothetical protein
MAYVSEWELLSEATNRVMTTAGLSKDQAQIDICRAVADGAVRIRGKLMKHATKPTTSKAELLGTDFEIRSEIKPEDLGWERSCPVKPWIVRRGSFSPSGSLVSGMDQGLQGRRYERFVRHQRARRDRPTCLK